MEFSRQEYWSGLPFPSPGDLPDPGIEPGSPTLQADTLLSEPPRKLFTTSSTKMYIVARPQHSPDVNLPPITQETPSFTPLAPAPQVCFLAPWLHLGEALIGKAPRLALFSQHAAVGAVSWSRVGSCGRDAPALMCLLTHQWTSGHLLCVFVRPGFCNRAPPPLGV